MTGLYRSAFVVVALTVTAGACSGGESSSESALTAEDRYTLRVWELQTDEAILAKTGPLMPMGDLLALPGWSGWEREGRVFCSFRRTQESYGAAFASYVLDWAFRYGDTQLLFGSWAAIFAIAADEELC